MTKMQNSRHTQVEIGIVDMLQIKFEIKKKEVFTVKC